MDVNRQIGIAPADLATGKMNKPPVYPVGGFRRAAVRSAILDAISSRQQSRQLRAEVTPPCSQFQPLAQVNPPRSRAELTKIGKEPLRAEHADKFRQNENSCVRHHVAQV